MKARARLLSFLLLAFALLFAQQGAAMHALSHLTEPLPGHSQQDKQLPHSPACEKCVAYAGVGSAVAVSGLSLPPAAVAATLLEFEPGCRLPQSVRHYYSRAPPSIV
ncbi:hypothetical protein SKTS_00940 [Sulfurimicrobium lacus]|uniref:DUF2946 domain-containing protein n=1 Tax=Sulfurimicrobium lacus TaxID=2715678 RepID=A0A6F8V690_9PROT|nr:hypothetical protein [Sulfurimicrobium lacus]BCB25208.1 hypothetical protein SKTS_00940 [Sulfurimicrobium lacus]